MCEEVKDFLKSGKLHKVVNCTGVTLSSKFLNPSTIKEFRPIACCSVLYKWIAKVLSLRIQQVLASLVSETQEGFIPGRKDADNVIIACKLVRAYNRKNISPRCMLKVDI